MLGLLVCECAAGVAAAVWPRCYGVAGARGGAVGALQSYYAVPDFEHFTAALDLAQTEVNTNSTNRIENGIVINRATGGSLPYHWLIRYY